MSYDPNCNHSWMMRAGLGGTVKVCGKCGWTVRVYIDKAPSETKQ
jgi:hypothetical protein